MYNSVSMETGFFVASLVAGVVSAFLYDLLRISRRIVGPSDAVVNVEDVLFLIVTTGLVFLAAYLKNSGEIRWQGVIGCIAGVLAYVFVVKNRFLNVGVSIIRFAVRIAEKIIKILMFPIRLIFRIFKKPVNFVMWYTGRGVRRARSLARISRNRLGFRVKNAGVMLRKK